MRFRASELAAALGAQLDGGDVAISGAGFDSRTITPGQLFVPIVAERDGHEFVGSAVSAGAVAYLTSQGPLVSGGSAVAITVGDTGVALQDAARWARGRTAATVIGVTGSVGKTTTKDLIAAALAPAMRVTANPRSFNNDQGLPVTILNADDRSDAIVLEMGMRGFGEIARLCDIALPRIGVVTNVGAAHTERVGGIAGVAQAKRELVESLDPSGTAILNADDPHVAAMAEHSDAGVVLFGTSNAADVHIGGIELDELARPRFAAQTPWGRIEIRLAVSGLHMVSNAAAAIAVAGTSGVPMDGCVEALSTATISGMRMERIELASGAVIVNDAYNANPMSMRAALEALAAMAARRHVAVVGLMAELDDPEAAHRAIAADAAELGVELVAVGTDLYGVEPARDALDALGVLDAGDVVLVKASRVAGLETIVADLLSRS